MTITLTVAGRIATVDATTHVVAGNTYPVTLALDSEWTGNLYLRVRFGSLYYDIPFASSAASVDVQMPVGYPEVGIGVYSEALEICTSEARVRLLRSILEAGEQVVEFDSDLYDQWAGEVTTLLTDNAFDAESTRPVQNAVLTAWKDTVPIDSALVHKTGTETVAGNKTFTSSARFEMGTPALYLKSNTQSTGTGRRATLSVSDVYGGSDTMFGEDRWGSSSGGYNYRSLVLNNLDRSLEQYLQIRAYSDHISGYMATYYPTDGGGNPQPLAADALVTSGNIAVDPRIVHTSGVETIAGAKTFTSLLTASNVAVKDARTPTVTMLKGSDEVANLASDGTQAGLTASSQFFGLRGLGTAPFGQAPSYTADNSADAKIVTRAMLAQSPTVVHTTGSETVAGVKTFQNGIDAYPQNWHDVFKTGMAVGEYCIFAVIPAVSGVSGKFIELDFIQSSNGGPVCGRMMFKASLTTADAFWVYRKTKGGNANMSSDTIHLVADSENLYLVSKRITTYGASKCRVNMVMSYGTVQSTGTSITFKTQNEMSVLSNLDGYTEFTVDEP